MKFFRAAMLRGNQSVSINMQKCAQARKPSKEPRELFPPLSAWLRVAHSLFLSIAVRQQSTGTAQEGASLTLPQGANPTG